MEIAIDGKENHFYSPQLVLRCRDDGDGTRIEARFGPDPYVWAFYVLGAGGLTVFTFFATMFGIGQWMIGQTPYALLVAPGAATLAGLVYGASFVGQGMSQDQMYFLRHAVEHSIDAEEVAAAEDGETAEDGGDGPKDGEG